VLAGAYAEVGQFDRARAAALQALLRAQASGDDKRAKEIEERLDGYRRRRPYRDRRSAAQ
jgi:hypothetical protein